MATEDPLRRNLSKRFADFDAEPRSDLRAAILASVASSPAHKPRIHWQAVFVIGSVLGLLLAAGQLGDSPPPTSLRPPQLRATGSELVTRAASKYAPKRGAGRPEQQPATSPLDVPDKVPRFVEPVARQTSPDKQARRHVVTRASVGERSSAVLPLPISPVAPDRYRLGSPHRSATPPQRGDTEYRVSRTLNTIAGITPPATLSPQETALAGQRAVAALLGISPIAIRPFPEPQHYPLPGLIPKIALSAAGPEQVKVKRSARWQLSLGVAPLLNFQAVTIPSTTGSAILVQNQAGVFSKERTGYQAFIEVEKPLLPRLSLAGSLRYTHLRLAGTYAHWTGRYQADFGGMDTPTTTPELAPVSTDTRFQAVSVRADLVYNALTNLPASIRIGTEYERGLSQPLTTTYLVLGAGSWHRLLGHRIAVEPTFRYALRPQFGLTNDFVQTRLYSVNLSIRMPLN